SLPEATYDSLQGRLTIGASRLQCRPAACGCRQQGSRHTGNDGLRRRHLKRSQDKRISSLIMSDKFLVKLRDARVAKPQPPKPERRGSTRFLCSDIVHLLWVGPDGVSHRE